VNRRARNLGVVVVAGVGAFGGGFLIALGIASPTGGSGPTTATLGLAPAPITERHRTIERTILPVPAARSLPDLAPRRE